jgi:lysophospholipase L1-like esterase
MFAAIEAGTRRYATPISPLEFLVSDPGQDDDLTDARKVRIFEGDPLLFWRLAANLQEVIWDFTLVSTNAQGIRYPRPVGPKAERAIRIVAVGDSVTFGYRVPVIWADHPETYDRGAQSYPELLEEWLSAANPALTLEVIPLAVPGYSSHQGRLWLERDIGDLDPDLVTACFGWNDVARRLVPDAEAMAGGIGPYLRAVTTRSQSLMHLALWLRPRPASTESSQSRARTSREEFLENHVAMGRLARAHGAGFLAIGSVYRDRETAPYEASQLDSYRDALRAAMAEAGERYLEISTLTPSAFPATQPLFGDAIHPNAKGHAVFAGAVLRALAEDEQLLRGVTLPVD